MGADPAKESRAGVSLTNLDQPLFDDAGATKRDLVDYLDAVRDRGPVTADDLAVPHPGLGVDGLAHRAEDAQRGEIVLLRVLLAEPHEGADRRRCRV